jgi:phage terminase small subunit
MGRLRTPTAIRKMNGNPSGRPFPANEPDYGFSAVRPPCALSPAAKKHWDFLTEKMTQAGVLKTVDSYGLATLCEDIALAETLRRDFRAMVTAAEQHAKDRGMSIKGRATGMVVQSVGGRRLLSTLNEIEGRNLLKLREYGMTPASRSRVEASGGAGGVVDPLESAIAG